MSSGLQIPRRSLPRGPIDVDRQGFGPHPRRAEVGPLHQHDCTLCGRPTRICSLRHEVIEPDRFKSSRRIASSIPRFAEPKQVDVNERPWTLMDHAKIEGRASDPFWPENTQALSKRPGEGRLAGAHRADERQNVTCIGTAAEPARDRLHSRLIHSVPTHRRYPS